MRLPALGFRCVLVLLLAYGLFLVGVCGCLAAARFRFSSTRVLYYDLLSLSSGLLPPTAATREGMYLTQKSYSSVLFTAVLGGALVCVGYGVGGGVLSSGGLR